jgi:hypothetical protein
MIVVLLLVLGGVALGLRSRVFILVPAGILLSAAALTVSLIVGDLDWSSVPTCLGYLAALNLGYAIGGLWIHSRGKHGGSTGHRNLHEASSLPAYRMGRRREA